MKINTSGIKYMEWRSPEDLHEDTLYSISELRFIKDEQRFLEELIKTHTIDLVKRYAFDESKAVIADLAKLRKEADPLLKRLLAHGNTLQQLVDEEEIPHEMEDYKEVHYTLIFDVIAYYSRFKKCKRAIFNFIRQIQKQDKQQRLLN